MQINKSLKQAGQLERKQLDWSEVLIRTTRLGRSLLKDDDYQHNPLVAFAFMQQMSLKAALKQWGSDTENAGMKEVNYLHWRDTCVPKRYSKLTNAEKSKVLESHMFIIKNALVTPRQG